VRDAVHAAGLGALLEAFETAALEAASEHAAVLATGDVQSLRRFHQRSELRRPWLEAVHALLIAASDQLPAARAGIERCLLSEDAWLRRKVAELVASAPEHAWDLLDVAREHVRRHGQDLELAAAFACAARGAPERRRMLLEMAGGAEEDEAEWACRVLGQLEEERKAIAECMASILARPNVGAALATAAILCATSNGVRTPELDGAILAAIPDRDTWNPRKAAMEAAAILALPLDLWLDSVADAVACEDSYEPSVGEVAAGILLQLGPRARAALPALRRSLEAEERAATPAADRLRHVLTIIDGVASP